MIEQANRLAHAGQQRPKQVDLKRAVSAAYYALFHAFCRNAADTLVGTAKKSRPHRAWLQLYRGLEHGIARSACEAARNIDFPQPIKDCADAFVELQKKRHAADYDPGFTLTRVEALTDVRRARDAIRGLLRSSQTDRKAFAVHLMVKRR